MSETDRVLFVNPMDYGTNPGVDAIAHGLDRGLEEHGFELRVVFADFHRPDCGSIQEEAIAEAARQGCAAAIVYVLDPKQPAEAVAAARDAGVAVVTFERPVYPVDGSLVYPNFNQGVYMAEELASGLRAGARVAIIGGPPIIDDDELVAGIVYGVDHSGLTRVNDPTLPEWRNVTDIRPGGREAALRVLEAFGDVEGLIPFNDETMLGTLDAIAELGREGRYRLVSRNGTPKAVEALRAGRTHGTWDIDCPGIGRSVARLVAECARDKERRAGRLAIGPIGGMVDLGNVSRWRPWSDRVEYRPLRVGL